MGKHVVIDFLSKGESHLNFNKSFIQSIPSNHKSFVFLGNKSHAKKLNIKHQKTINSDNIFWLVRVKLLFFKLLFTSKKHITVLAFENYLFPLLTILYFPFFLGKKFTIVVHNNIPGLASSSFKKLPLKLFVKLFNVKLICLTEAGKQKLDDSGFSKFTRFIPHMNYCHFKTYESNKNFDFKDNKINIVLLGRQAQLFEKHILPKFEISQWNKLKFHVFGNGNKLSELDFKTVLKTCDYCLFPNHDVGFRPSGILLDCISNNTPLIAPKEGHFKEFEQFKIGEFYSNNDELFKIFDELDKSEKKRATYKKSSFIEAQNKTSIKHFEQELVKLYSEF